MDVVERIKAELASGPVVLFMKGTPDFPQCGFSAQTVAALRAVGASFRHVNIFEEPEIRERVFDLLALVEPHTADDAV